MAGGAPEAQAPLAVTMGEPAGIGPDIIIAAFRERAALELPAFAVYGCAATLAERARSLRVSIDIEAVPNAREAAGAFTRALPVCDVPLPAPCAPGAPSAQNVSVVVGAISRAVADVAGGLASAIVTNPIAKAVLKAGGFSHPGHTEFLGELAAKHWPARPARPVMMLACQTLRVVPVTIHVPLSEVPRLITRELVVETGRIVVYALRTDFGIAQPRLAVAGLNPHAGEDGMLGGEEKRVIAPAVAELRADGCDIAGPLSADTMFHAAARATYDAALCMYHDQALIPIKTLAFDSGVNVTLGLPFVRTSPDHGTAFDIAGTGQASATSFIEALRLAGQISARRQVASTVAGGADG